MTQNDTLPRVIHDPSRLATSSVVSGIAAWGCFAVSLYCLRQITQTFMGDPPNPNPRGLQCLCLPLVVFVGLSVVLPGVAIVKGIRAIKLVGKNAPDGRWKAWVGVSLGALLYLAAVVDILFISQSPGAGG